MSHNIIICIDGSDFSEYAFDWYCDNLYRQGHTAILCHIPESYVNATMMSPGKILECQREVEEKTKALKAKFTAKATERNVPVIFPKTDEIKHLENDDKPGQIVIKFAEIYNPLFIVTGTRGMGTIRRTILGSVSDYIVHHAHCPVLVARHKKQKEQQQQMTH